MLYCQTVQQETGRYGNRDINQSLFMEKPGYQKGHRGNEYRYTETSYRINPEEFADLLMCNILFLHGRLMQSKVLKAFRKSSDGGHHANEAEMFGYKDPCQNGD